MLHTATGRVVVFIYWLHRDILDYLPLLYILAAIFALFRLVRSSKPDRDRHCADDFGPLTQEGWEGQRSIWESDRIMGRSCPGWAPI